MTNDPKFSFSKRMRILAKSNNLCWYCGSGFERSSEPSKAPCIDHLVPKSKGGTHDDDNLVACCRSCNSQKGRKDLEGFRASILRNQPEYRAACLLSAALDEASTPFDQEVIDAIEYLQTKVEPVRFHGETLSVAPAALEVAL